MYKILLAAWLALSASSPSAFAQEKAYPGYTGQKWARDFGIARGTCNAAALGATLAGNGDRVVAMMRASHAAAPLDAADRGCWGHALELSVEKKTVVWTNHAKLVRYRLTPTRNLQQTERPCREFTFQMSVQGREHLLKGVACRRGEGRAEAEWELKL
jgi:surface antigen